MGLAFALATGGGALASSHREAPFITKNPKTDNTDVYAFQSYDPARIAAASPGGTYDVTKAYTTIIANFQPFQDPFGGPNYFTMDDRALYEIMVDNVGDAHEHLTFQFQFTNHLADLQVPTGPGGNTKTSIPLVNDGPVVVPDNGSQNVSETYTVNVVAGDRRGTAVQSVKNHADHTTTFTKPMDNVGKKTFPHYPDYAGHYVYDIDIPNCATPGKMFVGQRAESFAVNIGPIFDLVDAPATVIAYGGTGNNRSLIPNPLAQKSVTSIALEIPSTCLLTSPTSTQTVVGIWSSASVKQARVLNPQGTYDIPTREGGAWTQISRLGMPLVNEVVIGVKDKDRFNSSVPADDGQFLPYVQYPSLPKLLEVLFGTAGVIAPTVARYDLVEAFLTGVPGVNQIPNSKAAEYERLNVGIPPTAHDQQNNLGAAGCFVNGTLTTTNNANCDAAGFPNGRRPGDDVVDIELRVAMGYLLAPADANSSSRLEYTDAVLQDVSQFNTSFPYLKDPLPGADTTGGWGGGN